MNTQSIQGVKNNLVLRGFKKTVDFLFSATNWVLVLLMAVMCVIMLTQVFSRYLFNTPLTWPEELGRYLFIWIVFLGAAIASRHQAHLGMDFATAKLPLKLRRIVSRFVEFLIFCFLILILYIAPEVLEVTGFQKSPVIHISMNYVYLAFPTASGLMILDLVTRWICPQSTIES